MPWLVRMEPAFRQDEAFVALACPNGASIQTESIFFCLDLSERDLQSDRIYHFLPWLVRIEPAFRQDKSFFALPCPKK
ncbi:hypothetical protein QNH20_01330 [Neobacillus sp. WH10]|uniref:hypothetical protein n=1 Tax=Neobacillus sp. WH10 TaxID=3047873 RepID=UPI0024C1FC64|nr:hypothetical protein [Neobacillus sp. WH10]WHY77849.1 hypothetical protein QNH20_01330 [Neobacillus sp. WH10]